MDACIKELYRIGIVPVVALEDAADALPLGAALKKGGVSAIEVTFRTAAAADAIRLLSREMPELLVGAGTVITKAQADAAIEAGAKFIVSPGFQPELVSYVLSKGVPMCPGTATPARWSRPWPSVSRRSKFFPAEQNGGAPIVKGALRALPRPSLHADRRREARESQNLSGARSGLCLRRHLARDQGRYQGKASIKSRRAPARP